MKDFVEFKASKFFVGKMYLMSTQRCKEFLIGAAKDKVEI